MEYSDSIEIAVTPAIAFAVITDLPAMGHFSPENTGGHWVAGSGGPARGARFLGSNTRGTSSWITKVKVTTFDPPSEFAFEVRYKTYRVARWKFTIDLTRTGCRVTETWKDRRNWFRRRAADSDGFKRVEFTKQSIRETLEKLKSELESPYA